jgi:hypothetical protein
VSVASAETIQFSNYTATFDMKQSHIIDNNSIRTFYGNIFFGVGSVPTMDFIGTIKYLDGTYGKLYKLNFGDCKRSAPL